MALPECIEIIPCSAPFQAEITVPGSKSITNRALVLAALADGELAVELTQRLTAPEIAATAARVKFLLKHRIHPYPSEDWPAVPWPPV